MRVYIIGNDGITLCREAPTAVNDTSMELLGRDRTLCGRWFAAQRI
jgi:hypothetical protein